MTGRGIAAADPAAGRTPRRPAMSARVRAGLLGALVLLAGSRAGAQQPGPKDRDLSLDLPTAERLFRVESEARSLARIERERGKPVPLPAGQPLPDEAPPYPFPAQTAYFPAAEVCYRTLYF